MLSLIFVAIAIKPNITGLATYDINVHILSSSQQVIQGDKLLMEINLPFLDEIKSKFITLKYFIKDSENNIIALEEEQVEIDEVKIFIRELEIPDDLSPNTYISLIEIYEGGGGGRVTTNR